MSPVTLRRCTYDEVDTALFAGYAAESSIAALGPARPQAATYRAMEEYGLLYLIGAWRDGHMVGFISFLVSELPHYGQRTATAESYYVAPEHRQGGVGLKLLHAAEALAKEVGAVGFFVSAPMGGRLAEVMPRIGYKETNRVFFRGLM